MAQPLGTALLPIRWPMQKHSGSMRLAGLLEIGGKTRRIDDIQGQYMGLLKFNTPLAWSKVEALLDTLDQAVRDRLDLTGLSCGGC